MTDTALATWWGDRPPAVRIDVEPDGTEHRDHYLVVSVFDGYDGPVPGFRMAEDRTEPLVVADPGTVLSVAGSWFWWPL